MKKILRNLSLMTCLCCLFCLIVFAAPGVVGFDDSAGFAILYLSILLPFVSSLLWTVFSLKNKNIPGKLKVTAVTSLITHTVLLLNTFLDFLPFGGSVIWAQLIIATITGALFITFSNE